VLSAQQGGLGGARSERLIAEDQSGVDVRFGALTVDNRGKICLDTWANRSIIALLLG